MAELLKLEFELSLHQPEKIRNSHQLNTNTRTSHVVITWDVPEQSHLSLCQSQKPENITSYRVDVGSPCGHQHSVQYVMCDLYGVSSNIFLKLHYKTSSKMMERLKNNLLRLAQVKASKRFVFCIALFHTSNQFCKQLTLSALITPALSRRYFCEWR